MQKGIGFWLIQIPAWFLLVYLIYAQAIPAFNYDLGIKMGTQEPAEQITEVGVAFWYGFAFADLLVYIPLLMIGLIGHIKSKYWGSLVLSAALGISIYWPVVSLSAVVKAQNAVGWKLNDIGEFWIVLPAITLWSIWALWQLYCEHRRS